MKRRDFLKLAGVGLAALARPERAGAAAGRAGKPNFVIVLADDLGYADLGCFGSKAIRTPRLDAMAAEGTRFTNFYAQTVCGPSRAALMTGCYPLRVARKGNKSAEFHPRLDSREVTVAEVLREAGYATAAFGKWDLAGHLQAGYDPELLPLHQGFDHFFGTPTSNDAVVNLLRGDEVIEKQADMATLTRRYTDEAIGFIRKSAGRPFFVYLAQTMPHVKLAASEAFAGKSPRGLFGDVVEEIDWNAGRLLDALKELGLERDTYVIFTSDNGPWIYSKGPESRPLGGNAEPLRGAKTSAWEGGLRVPCVMWAPGRIAAGGVCDEVATTMDLLPTLARLGGGQAPGDRTIDGHDITALIHGERGAKSPTAAFYYYVHTALLAVRAGRWKLHLPRTAGPPWVPQGWKRFSEETDMIEIREPMLFDLEADIGEAKDVAREHPEVVKRMLGLAERAREDIGDYDRAGKGARFFDAEPRRPDAAQWRKARTPNN